MFKLFKKVCAARQLAGRLAPRRGQETLFTNIAEGVHGDGCITKLADAIQATRHVLVKIGSDSSHVAVTTAATEIPLGACDDEAAAAEDPVNVQLLGQKPGTILIVAGGTVDAGDWLVATASGACLDLADAGAGNLYLIGRALTSASLGGLVEVQHMVPVLRVV